MGFVKRSAGYQAQKDHGRTLDELKKFGKPNLDDGNRFFEDNRQMVGSVFLMSRVKLVKSTLENRHGQSVGEI